MVNKRVVSEILASKVSMVDLLTLTHIILKYLQLRSHDKIKGDSLRLPINVHLATKLCAVRGQECMSAVIVYTFSLVNS